MDLDALRRAALSSKKRKLAVPSPSPSPSDDKEEGEIEDDSEVEVDPPATFSIIKDECNDIIAQLLSYGIPPDYMLSIGVSREILKLAFHELDLDASVMPRSPNLSAKSIPFEPARVDLDNRDNDDPVVVVDYTALEQEKRKKLFAKKAALRARNQRQAQHLETEFETLFAAAERASPPLLASGREGGEPVAKRPRHSNAPTPTDDKLARARLVHDLRETIDHTEETVEVPAQGPFAYNPSFAPPPRPLHAPPPPPPPTQRRPVAADLEHLPSHRLSGDALSRQRIVGGYGGSLFNAVNGNEESQSLVIDISDDDDDDDDDRVDGDDEADGDHEVVVAEIESSKRIPSRIPSPAESRTHVPTIPPSTSSPSTPSNAIQVGETVRQRQLEEKELEIKRIMERIRNLETRKKRAASSVSEEASIASPALEKPAAGATEQPPSQRDVTSNCQQPVASTEPIQPQSDPTCLRVDPVYRPYASTLSRYPLLGGRPSSSLSIPLQRPSFPSSGSSSASGAPNNNSQPTSSSSRAIAAANAAADAHDASDVGSAGLSTFVAHKHRLDPSRKWCKAESLGGVCQDGNCKSVHERDFVPKDEEKAEYLLQQHASSSS